MNLDWSSFLRRAGAQIRNDRVHAFANADSELHAAVDRNVICDLSHMGLIRAAGVDTEKFLQGQITSDVSRISDEHSQLGGYCNSKGRMIATFRHFKHTNEHYLQMPREAIAATLRRLGMFVLRDRTALTDASDRLARFGLSGPDAATLLETTLSAVPCGPDNAVQVGEVTVIRVPGLLPRFEIHGAPQRLGELWSELARSTRSVGADPWRLLDIRAGIPWIYSSTSEAFVPQMTNLQLLDGISFRKGCYVGQEVVARTQHLGKLKRRMYHARINHGEQPLPGDDLFVDGIGENQNTGKIVDACQSPDGGHEVLAVILIEQALSGSVHLGNVNGPLLDVQPLVYALEESRLPGTLG